MSLRSVILMGGPDSGKTNYLARLLPNFRKRKGTLRAEKLPDNIEYVDGAVEYLMQGSFAPRSDRNLEEGRRDFTIQVRNFDGKGPLTELLVPDITGELWRNAVMLSELPEDWMQSLEEAAGALLFVRVHSELNVQPMDWVTARRLLELYAATEDTACANGEELQGEAEVVAEAAPTSGLGEPTGTKPEAKNSPPAMPEIPTQVLLCELLRYLDLLLVDRADGGRPRVAVVVAAWDLLDAEMRAAGPLAYLDREFPLFAGRLRSHSRLDIRLFGLSIVGGDLENDPAFKESFLKKDIVDQGWVVVEERGQQRQDADLTLPISWTVGE